MLHIREKGLKTSQAFMLKYYDIPHDPKKLHDSLYDVEMTFEIFKKQIFNIDLWLNNSHITNPHFQQG